MNHRPTAATCILVVDDDPDILTLLEDNLAMDGYRVVTAASGRQALEMADAARPDLVILDLMLPDMDGIRVCRSIRSASPVPIIVLTARDAVADKVLGLESGADDYLVKPFDYLELAARIKARLRRAGNMQDCTCTVQAGPVCLDPDQRQAWIDGRPVQLTPRQFDLLLLLCRNAGRVLERSRIRQALWPDGGVYRWSRAIDVHIQHLRAKIEPEPSTPRWIVTVPGVGYRFDAEPRPPSGP